MHRVILWLAATLLASAAVAKEWPGKVPSAAARGEELYDRHCVSCHGPKAAGDGVAASSLAATMQDFSKGWGKRDTEELIRVVMRGKGVMPAFEVSFGREDAEKVIDWMGAVGRKKPKPAPDEENEEVAEDEAEEEAPPAEQQEAAQPE